MSQDQNQNPNQINEEYTLIIIGGGIGGSALALRAAQNGIKSLWVLGTAETRKKSRAQWVYNIDNMIGLHYKIGKKSSKTDIDESEKGHEEKKIISTKDIIKNTKDRISEEYSDLIHTLNGKAVNIQKNDDNDLFEILIEGKTEYKVLANYVAMSTGVMDRQPVIFKQSQQKEKEKENPPIKNLFETKWIYPFANHESALYCIRCEGHLTHKQRAMVIGHSEVAHQVAIMLHERYESIEGLLLNGETSEASPETLKLFQKYGIKIFPHPIVDLTQSSPGKLKSVILAKSHHLHSAENIDTTEIPCDFLFVSLGLYQVYHDLPRQLGAELVDPEGKVSETRVLINSSGETTVPNLFCVGDMATRKDESVMMQIYTAQEYAVRAIDKIDRRRRLKKREEILKS